MTFFYYFLIFIFLKFFASGLYLVRDDRSYAASPHLVAPPPKLYFARAYTIPPATQARQIFDTKSKQASHIDSCMLLT